MDYRVLGPLEVTRDGIPIELGPPKQRAVLAVLLLERGRVVSTDRIIEAVWGDDAPGNVAASLQAYISNLRRVLRDDVTAASPIVRRAPGYLLDIAAADLDRTTFLTHAGAARDAVDDGDWRRAAEKASAALATWRGPVLADQGDVDWVRAEAGALEERRAECVENEITAMLGIGNVSEAVVEAERLRAADPLRERASWLLMIALYRAGRAADALQVYHGHTADLSDQLGLEPAPALRDLQGAILRQEAELMSWPDATPRRAPAVVEPEIRTPGSSPDSVDAEQAPLRSADPLIGRTREVELIRGTIGDGRDEVRWVVLSGPAGIGKTRLAEETLGERRSAGSVVVRTNCPEDDGTPAWWPVRALVRALGAEPDELLALPPGTDADAARYAIYERLDVLVRRAAIEPLVILVDDVQWADPASFGWLTHLATTVYMGSLTILLTIRSGVGGEELDRLLAAVARHGRARQLEVGPLDAADVRLLVSQVSGEQVDQDEAQDVAERTGGNPFFVTEFARVPREERNSGDVPLAIRAVLGRRLASLDAGVLQVLRTAAVAGDTLDIPLLAAVTKLDRDALADLLDDAADDHVIVADADTGRYGFTHALLRDELLTGLSSPRRQRLHAQIAEALDGQADQLTRRATHLLAAFPLVDAPEVFAACRAAAEQADAQWQSETAAEWWAAALRMFDQLPPSAQDEDDRDRMLVAQVAALARAGRRQSVLDAVESELMNAIANGRTASAGLLAATLLRTAGSWPWTFGGESNTLLGRLAGVERLVASDPAAHSRILGALAVGSYYDPDGAVPARLSARALEVAETTGDDEVIADAVLARALSFSGVPTHVRESQDAIDRLSTIDHRLRNIDDVIQLGLQGMVDMSLGRIDQAADGAEAGITGADNLRLPVSRMQFRWFETAVAVWRGDLEQAQLVYDRAIELHLQTEIYLIGADVAIMPLRWEQGRLGELGPMGEAISSVAPWAAAARLAMIGEVEEADRLIADSFAEARPLIWTTIAELTLVAHVLADLSRPAQARAVLERLEPVADQLAWFGQFGGTGPVALGMARLHALLGETDEARSRLAQALEISEAAQGICAVMRCRLLAAELDDADTATFERLAAEADGLGMRGVAVRAREFAARAA